MNVQALCDLLRYERRQEAKRDYACNVEWMSAMALYGFVSGGEKIPVRPITEAFSREPAKADHADKTQEEIRTGLVNKILGSGVM